MNAIVEHRGKKRKARGFSCAELVDAGLSWVDCARLKLRVDKNRSSVYEENVKSLKELAKKVPEKKKKKQTAKKTEPKKNE